MTQKEFKGDEMDSRRSLSIFVRSLGLSVVIFLMAYAQSWSQSVTGQISGTVTDTTGAALPQVEVTARNIATDITRKVQTGSTGLYIISLLQPGQYSLTFVKSGFEHAEQPSLILQVNQSLTFDVKLSVGHAAETIQVDAAAEQLQTTSSELGTAINETAIADLPLNGRNFTQLLTLTPGATPISTSQAGSIGSGMQANVGVPGSAFSQPSINGQWNRSNFYLLDGVTNTSWFSSTYNVLPIVDDIQEFKVQSHNSDAQYGGVLGGVVNVVTKSGTNQYHGSAWEFLRNSALDARNPFTDATSTKPAPFEQNEFGTSVGGPLTIPKVYKGSDRTFFFFAYEGWRFRQPSTSFLHVPTAAELSGDFSADPSPIYDPSTTVLNSNGTYSRTAFQGNIIPSNRLSALATGFFAKTYDAPNVTNNPNYNYLNKSSSRNSNDTYTGRLDEHIGANDSAWFRYTTMSPHDSSQVTSMVTSSAYENPVEWGVGETHIFGPHLVFDARFGYSHENWFSGVVPIGGNAVDTALGFTGTKEYGAVDLELAAPYGDANIAGPENLNDRNLSFSGTLTWLHGRHNIALGYQLMELQYSCCATSPGLGQRNQYVFANAQTADPSNLGTTGNSLASALLGIPTGIYFAAQDYKFHFPSWAPYVQDQWQVTKKLSLTLGLRYDYFSTPDLTKGTTSFLDPSDGTWLIGGGVLPPACSSTQSAPCIPGGSLANVPYGSHIKVASNPNIGPNPVTSNFGPRIGLAYQLDPKTAIRAGYGIVYDSLIGITQTFQGNVGSWPDATNTQAGYNALGQPLTTLTNLQSAATSALPAASPWSDQNWMYDPNRKNSRSQQWNLEVERQMTSKLLLSVGYVGSYNDRLPTTGLFNVSPTAGLGAAGVPFPWATTEFMEESIGEAKYNGLQVKAAQRYQNGLQFLVSYTWSKVLEDGGSGLFGVENGSGGSGGYSAVQNLSDLSHNWGVAGYDIKQYLSVSGTYELPIGMGKQWLNKGGVASYLLGDWSANTLAVLRSGQPFNLDVSGDVANIDNQIGWFNYARPNQVGNPHVSHPTANEYFNPAAFAVPVNSFGNTGQNSLRSAPVYDVDFSLFKKFRFGEAGSLEFRAEAFNLFNIQCLGVPGSDIGTTDAGVVSSVVENPRQFQFGLKLAF